uniref:Uncharacterized protein n=1 Tax=Rhodopseudomonas palustris (strain DX-1) TaxID=652103 RepID=E6VP08_RHOPX
MNEMLQVTLHVRDTGNPDEPVGKDKATSLGKWLGIWRATAESFEWPAVENAIDRLETRLKKGARYRDLEYGLRAINDGVHDGLKFQLVYRYPNDRASVLSRWKSDWADVIERFPEAAEDMRAGTDLWALGHYTASVFHMMRVLERGLGALSAELGVSYTIQNWQNVIEQIEAAIRQSQKTLPKGETRNARLQFLSEAAKEFTYFKDGWRNYVSHNKGTYTDAQARSVMEHVRQFMMSLAINLPVTSISSASAETPRVDAGLSE